MPANMASTRDAPEARAQGRASATPPQHAPFESILVQHGSSLTTDTLRASTRLSSAELFHRLDENLPKPRPAAETTNPAERGSAGFA